MRFVLLVLGPLAASCASAAAYRELPKPERDAFEVCASFVEQRACGQHTDSVVRSFCLSDVAGKYGALPTLEARRAFLVEAGCPNALVAGR